MVGVQRWWSAVIKWKTIGTAADLGHVSSTTQAFYLPYYFENTKSEQVAIHKFLQTCFSPAILLKITNSAQMEESSAQATLEILLYFPLWNSI